MIAIDSTELEDIYSKTLGAGIKVLAVTSSHSGEGVSSLATALTQRHLLSGKTALFIDFNSDKQDHFGILNDPFNVQDQQPKLISNHSQSYALLGVTVPTKNKLNLKWRNPGFIENYLKQLQHEFDAIIIDAGPLHRQHDTLIPTQRIIASSEACLLIILSTHTTVPMVDYSCQTIQQCGGHLIGCVMNNWHNPSLKQELFRELNSLPKWFPQSIRGAISQWINNNRLLSLNL